VTFLEKTVRSTAFIACRSGIRSYWLREEARTPETCPGPGGNTAARTGARTGARAGTDASSGSCEAREEVIACGNDQLEILSRPPDGGLFFGESKGWSSTGCKGRLGFNIMCCRELGRRPQAGSPREDVISGMLSFPLCPRRRTIRSSLFFIRHYEQTHHRDAFRCPGQGG
jgi:hypothetical protein